MQVAGSEPHCIALSVTLPVQIGQEKGMVRFRMKVTAYQKEKERRTTKRKKIK